MTAVTLGAFILLCRYPIYTPNPSSVRIGRWFKTPQTYAWGNGHGEQRNYSVRGQFLDSSSLGQPSKAPLDRREFWVAIASGRWSRWLLTCRAVCPPHSHHVARHRSLFRALTHHAYRRRARRPVQRPCIPFGRSPPPGWFSGMPPKYADGMVGLFDSVPARGVHSCAAPSLPAYPQRPWPFVVS